MRPLVCVLLFAFALGLPCAAAERKHPEDPVQPVPPQPVPQTLSVPRGGHLEIPLKVYGIQRDPPRYLIRTPPEHGKLSAPAPKGREGYVVQYDPPADLGVKTVRFAYAAQNAAGVSAPAEVIVNILDEEPRLMAPAALDFAKVLAGSTARQEIEIENVGGGLAEGVIKVVKPWSIEAPAEYHLGAGERRRVAVLFTPVAGGASHGEILYTSQPDRATVVQGDAESPLILTPVPLTLSHPERDPERRGLVTIANHTPDEVTLAIQAVPRLHIPEEVKVPAGGELALPVTVAPTDTSTVREEVTFTGAGVVLRLPVNGRAVAPLLLADADRLLLPPVTVGRSTSGTVTLRNAGATEGYWKCQAPAPFSAQPAEFRIAGGGEQAVVFTCAAPEAGTSQARVRFIGEQQTVEVQLEADVLARAGSPGTATMISTRSSDPGLGGDAAAGSAAAPTGTAPAEPTAASTIETAVRGVRISAYTSSSLTLRWPAVLTQGRAVQVDARNLYLGPAHDLRQEWKTLPSVTIRTEGAETVAEIRRLQPATVYSLRVLAAGPGSERAPLFYIDGGTARGEATWRVTPGRVMLGILLLVAGAFAWRKFRGE